MHASPAARQQVETGADLVVVRDGMAAAARRFGRGDARDDELVDVFPDLAEWWWDEAVAGLDGGADLQSQRVVEEEFAERRARDVVADALEEIEEETATVEPVVTWGPEHLDPQDWERPEARIAGDEAQKHAHARVAVGERQRAVQLEQRAARVASALTRSRSPRQR